MMMIESIDNSPLSVGTMIVVLTIHNRPKYQIFLSSDTREVLIPLRYATEKSVASAPQGIPLVKVGSQELPDF